MSKRSYLDFQSISQSIIELNQDKQTCSSKKFKHQNKISDDISLMLTNIFTTLEKIVDRLDSCEKKIDYLYECQIKLEQEKIEQKNREAEIFNSYII
jgi:hypothetical protein